MYSDKNLLCHHTWLEMVHIDIIVEFVIMRMTASISLGFCASFIIIDDMDITSSDETISFPIFNCYKIYGCKYKYIIMIIELRLEN